MIKLVAGTIHDKIPADLKNILLSNDTLREIWLGLTPLARNEWICWIDSVKRPETRERYILDSLLEGYSPK